MADKPTQGLTDRVPIVDKDGRPTQYFIRLLQERGITLDDKITATQATEISEEVADEALTDHFITAGVGLDGGGTLISNPTIDLDDTAVTPGTYGDATNVAQITVDQQGRITAATDVPISGGGGGSSIQDAIDLAVASWPLDTGFTVNDAIDIAVTQGDFAALVFHPYCPGSGATMTSSSTITVPVGKTAVLVRCWAGYQVYTNPSFYAARLRNQTTATNVYNPQYGANAMTSWPGGSILPDTANSTITVPVVVGVAGDVLEAIANTASDGNTRTVPATYIVAFV